MAENQFALRGGSLVDGNGQGAILDAVVVVRGGRVEAAGSAADVAIPDGVPIYDVHGKTVMPGLIDGHVHLRSSAVGERAGNYLWQATAFIEEQTLHCAGNARIALDAGVTTVRDMAGGRPEVATKHAIDDGVLPGARVIASGFVGMTAGHGDMFCPAGISERYWPPADGVDECRKLVRRYARDGLDLIKICTSGGVLSTGDKNEWRNYTMDETFAIVDEAHALEMKVAVHAHTRAGILQALEAGVDTIEHGSSLDDELIDLMLECGAMLCPTLAITDFILNHGREAGIPGESLDKAQRLKECSLEGHRAAYAAGVPIFMGTDSSAAYRFGNHARELTLMHEMIGLTPIEAIVAATRTAAEALGIEDEIGTVEPGKLADLLVVDGDPIEDITILEDADKILGVFQAGDLKVDRGLAVRQPSLVG
ncbi:amidohydrolase family protein [soil metagenome]